MTTPILSDSDNIIGVVINIITVMDNMIGVVIDNIVE